jgi:hypothetical protein
MFDRCRNWRRELSHRADGTLPLARWGALEQHLTRCNSCRRAAQADEALRDVLSRHTGSLASDEAFDARILGALAVQSSEGLQELTHARQVTSRDQQWINLEFFRQMLGGAIAAASVTAICFYPALHMTASPPNRSTDQSALQNDYGIPSANIESLLSNPSPRAALLWSPPASRRSVRPVGIFEMAPRLTDITSPVRPLRHTPQQHGSLTRTVNLS